MGYVSVLAVLAIIGITLAVTSIFGIAMARAGSPKANIFHVASLILLGGTTVAIAWISLIRQAPQVAGSPQINLIPFRGIIDQFSNPNSQIALVNLLGNFVLYVPVGFLAAICSVRPALGLVSGMTLSAMMEVAQLIIRVGALDIDDFLLNSLGVASGTLIATFVIRRYSHALRIVGIDAPEIAHEGKPVQCGAETARTRLRPLRGSRSR